MRKNLLIMTLVAGCLLTTGCASKKDLVNCQNENKQLTSDYQSTKEQLAASNARVASLEEQLWQAKNDYAKLQNSLDKSLQIVLKWPRGAWHEVKVTNRFWIVTIIMAALAILTLKIR